MGLLEKLIFRWFGSAEDNSVEFKIEVKKGNQGYDYICWYKVIGYWRYAHEFRWKKYGLLVNKQKQGKWNDDYEEFYLKKLYELFLKNKGKRPNYRSVPIMKVVEDIKNNS